MSYSRSPRRSRSRSGGKMKLSIRNLDPHTDELDIEEVFKHYGEIEDIYVPRDDKMVCNRGYAFVTFMSSRDASAALKEDNAMLRGQRLRVAFAHRRPGNMRPPRSYVPSRDGPGGLLREWVAKTLRERSPDGRRHRIRSPWRGRGSRSRKSRSPYRRSLSPYRRSPRRRVSRSRSRSRYRSRSRSLSDRHENKRSRSDRYEYKKRSRSRSRDTKRLRSRSRTRDKDYRRSRSR